MRKFALLLLLLPSVAWAQVFPTRVYPGGRFTVQLQGVAANNCTTPPYSFTGDATSGVCSSAAGTVNLRTSGTNRFSVSATTVTSTLPILAPDGTAGAPSLAFSTDATTGLFLSSGTPSLSFSGVGRWSWNSAGFFPFASDSFNLGAATRLIPTVFASRAIQGSKSKALVDNTPTIFATMAIPQTAGANYGGGKIIYTIFCKDAANQATESGEVYFACHNLAGSEACTFGTPTNVIMTDGTASFVAPVFAAAAGADLVSISVQSDCTGVTPTTHTIQARFDLPQINTLAFP